MKWYAFKEDDKTYTMLLDHNTTASTPWITQDDYEQTGSQTTTPSEVGLTYASEKMTNGLPDGIWDSSGTNNRGPITLLNQLKADTTNWEVAETLSDSNSYIAEWTANTNNNYSGNQKYTINYNGYKARVLSAQEINEITEKGTNTLSNIVGGYFDTNCSSPGTCSVGTNNYAWIFDYTGVIAPVGANNGAPDCTQHGCNEGNNFDPVGYWTMLPDVSSYYRAWDVEYNGVLNGSNVVYTASHGVRPVITVSKSKLGIN